jgi:hypothetical protein
MNIFQNSTPFVILSSIAALTLAATSRADNGTTTIDSAPPPSSAPALTTPTRSTPLSASQTSATPIVGVETNASAAGFTGWIKPAWLSDLSFGVKESYDDNLLRVSGKGLPTESSWVTVASLKLGFDLSSLVAADPGTIQTFSLIYQPDRANYSQDSGADFTAHRVNTILKGKSGGLKFGFDDAFLYNDGNKLAPTYALNQLSDATANQNDKYRNSLAHAPARERLNQYQDRYTAFLQYDTKYLFFRPISALNYINMGTVLFNTSLAPYKGYQDYVDRYDVNVGADVGLKVTPHWAFTLGYRDGYQYQQQYSLAVNTDQHFSSNHYQRLLLGLEGKLNWLTAKLTAGPDFRDFNPDTPISNLHTTRFYGEAAVTASLSPTQSITVNYKDYIFVSSTGLVPYEEYTYSLIYHWSVTKQLGLDLGGKLFEHNYTLGNDEAGSAPSLREDLDYEGLGGITYAITPHVIASVGYNFDDGQNGLSSLPAKYAPSYRDFKEGVFSAGLQYRF